MIALLLAPRQAQETAPPADPMRCDFCGKSRREVKGLVAGKGAAICNECVGLAVEILTKAGML